MNFNTGLAEVDDETACPECRNGKHRNCDSTAWDFSTDVGVACECWTVNGGPYGGPCDGPAGWGK